MKKTSRNHIDELARRAIAERIAAEQEPETIPLPAFRGTESHGAELYGAQNRNRVADIDVPAHRRYASPFAFVAAALLCCLILPPLAIGKDTQLSHISAAVHSRGAVERCRMTALDILSLASKGRYDRR
jgi:hypothetical protein